MSRLRRLFSRPSGSSSRPAADAPPSQADARRATTEHFRTFVTTRVGVEGYLEPSTGDMPTTLLLIATTGEWTRRRVPDEKAARGLADDLGIPLYDVRRTGYPQRMREWNTRRRRGEA